MKTAIQIIREAYSFAGICPTSTNLSAEMSAEGLEFLNELLYEWNMANYFPFTNNTLDARINGGSAIIAPDSDTFTGGVPAFVQKCFWKNGSVWEPIRRVSYENIWARRVAGASLPSFFAFSLDENGKGVLTFDCENGNFLCRIIYNRNLPPMEFSTQLNAPPQYEQLLKYGVAVKVCVRYGLPPDVKKNIEDQRDAILDAIEKVNQFKHEVNIGTTHAFRSPSELVNGCRVL